MQKLILLSILQKTLTFTTAFKEARNAAVVANGGNSLEPDIAQSLYDSIKKKLQVQGNIWYISQSLSKLKQVNVSVSEELQSELSTIENLFPDKVIQKDFCTVFALDIYELIKAGLHNMCNSVRDYIIELRNKFYPPGSGGTLILVYHCLFLMF